MKREAWRRLIRNSWWASEHSEAHIGIRLNFYECSTLITLNLVDFFKKMSQLRKKPKPVNLILKGMKQPLEPERASEAREARRSGEYS